MDRDGNILSLRTVPTGNPGDDSLRRAASLGEQVAATAQGLGMRVVGAGIGLPELVEDGRIASQAVVAWTDEGVESAFSRYGPVRVETDIRAAALAESRLGSGGRAGVTLYVNLGTGISHCLLIEGSPFEGQHGRALMSGSALLTVLDEEQNELVRYRVEDVASGRVSSTATPASAAIPFLHTRCSRERGEATPKPSWWSVRPSTCSDTWWPR